MLLAVLLFTMTASSFQIFAIAVLAVDLIADLEISRTELGLLGSLNTAVGALTAPTMGRVTDRIGPRRSVLLVLLTSALGMALMAVATHWVVLAVAAAVSGCPQGWGNPTTNALIAERVPLEQQGTVTGIKQSGVQFGVFLSGLSLPGLALWLGWRGASWIFAGLFLASAILVVRGIGPAPAVSAEDQPTAAEEPGHRPIPSFIWVVSLYAFLFGSAGGAIGRFFPLWANEEIGLSTVIAGALVAVGGLLGIVARIWAGRVAQERIAPPRLLNLLALIGALYCVVLLVTDTVGPWILWPGALFYAVGIGAWNAVAMLAVITTVPKASAGRASGIVMLGFLGGLSAGSPLAGLVVDRFDTYQPVWVGALVLSLMSAVVIRPPVLRWRRGGNQPSTA